MFSLKYFDLDIFEYHIAEYNSKISFPDRKYQYSVLFISSIHPNQWQ